VTHTFWSEETDRVCRRAVISAKLCSKAATRLAFRGRREREREREREKKRESVCSLTGSQHNKQMSFSFCWKRREGMEQWTAVDDVRDEIGC